MDTNQRESLLDSLKNYYEGLLGNALVLQWKDMQSYFAIFLHFGYFFNYLKFFHSHINQLFSTSLYIFPILNILKYLIQS